MFDPIFFKDLEDAIALEDTHLLAVEQENASGIRKQKKLTFGVLKSWILAIPDIVANIAYRDRVKTKDIWTGPLSVVSTPTSLNGGEAFSDWDIIVFITSMKFDTFGGEGTFQNIPASFWLSTRSITFFSDTKELGIQRLSDTSFQLTTKTGTSNIYQIFGVKL